jgi:hypothetical protein
MATDTQPRSGRPKRHRWRSWLALGLMGTALTLAGLAPGWRGLSSTLAELFERPQGLSDDDMRQIETVRKLGGDAHVLQWTPGFLGRFGRHGLLHVSFHGKPLGDEGLAGFIKTYGDRISGLYLSNTGITDEGLRHLAGLPVIEDLKIGNMDPRQDPVAASLPQNTITDASLIYLRGLTSLRSLGLYGLPVTDEGLDVLKDLPNLGGLYLDRTKVRGPWFGRLKSLPGLALIYLDGSTMTDEGLGYLKGASNLQMLSLVDIPLTAQGLNHLISLPKLNRLDIKGCGLDFDAIDDFQVACPAVKLE